MDSKFLHNTTVTGPALNPFLFWNAFQPLPIHWIYITWWERDHLQFENLFLYSTIQIRGSGFIYLRAGFFLPCGYILHECGPNLKSIIFVNYVFWQVWLIVNTGNVSKFEAKPSRYVPSLTLVQMNEITASQENEVLSTSLLRKPPGVFH